MKQKITDIAAYVHDNFFTIIVLIGLLAPALWWGCSTLKASTIESLNSNIETLKERNDFLKEQIEAYKELAIQKNDKNIDWAKIESNP